MRVLVTGANGNLGPYVVDALRRRGCGVSAWRGRGDAPDLTDAEAVAADFAKSRADAVIHLAAMARPTDAQRDPQRAAAINDAATRNLLALSDASGARFVYVSTDLAFDGSAAPYAEDAPPTPLSVYARSKVAPEAAVIDRGGVVVRVSLMYGPGVGGANGSFFDRQVAALRAGEALRLFHDEYRTPLALAAAAAGLAEVAASDAAGLFHLGGPERMNRVEFAERLAAHLGLPVAYEACSRLDTDSPEPRPADVSLDSAKFRAAFPAAPFWNMEEALTRMGV